MSITINGSGSVVGLTAGGLPDASVVTADIADANITAAKLNGAQTGTAPIYGCRAWVNFNGTRNESDTGASTNGANVLIRASGNVSSVLKNATGDYTVNFTTAMPDANYALSGFTVASASNNLSSGIAFIPSGPGTGTPATKTASAARILVGNSAAVGALDMADVSLLVFR